MKIILGADHQGINTLNIIKDYLISNEIEVETIDLPHHDLDDYPDFAYAVCQKVLTNDALGILICGSGIGMSIAANKIAGIRCARVFNSNDAFTAKNHNGANVIAIACNIADEELKLIVDTFIATKPPTEERHLRRIEKVTKIEKGIYHEL